jgi:HSP20 family protein
VSEEVEQVRTAPQPLPWPERLWDWFEAPEFGRWFEGLRPWSRDEWRLRIEEQLIDDTMVLRAELPGIEPDKDVEITVSDGLLHLRAHRRFEKTEEEKGYTRSEFRYGSFARTMRVPRELSVEDVTASYHDGILEVRYPYKVPTEIQVHKVPVTRG